MSVRRASLACLLLCVSLLMPAAAQADFGLVPESTKVKMVKRNGTVARQAGSHPFAASVQFELKTNESGKTDGGEARDALVELPPGFVGNPLTMPTCSRQEFEGGSAQCPPSTQIGILEANVSGLGQIIDPVFNLTPAKGYVAQFGVSALGFVSIQYATLRSEEGPEGEPAYSVVVSAPNFPLEVLSGRETIWGMPPDPEHDAQRGESAINGGPPVKSEVPQRPFLTLPTDCAAPPLTRVLFDSKLNPGVFVGESAPFEDEAGNPAAMTGCGEVPFSPDVFSAPSAVSAETSSGLDFELTLPNKGLLGPESITETEPEKVEVTLPAGVAVNPSSANGITACTLGQFRSITAATPPGAGCPEASKVGTLLARTPLLEEPVEGSVYLAQPRSNPAGSFLGIYIVAREPQRGIAIKQFGEVHADPATGRLTTVVNGMPPLPYSSIQLNLRSGPRAPLITPSLCGPYTTTARLYPFSNPANPVVRTAPFSITTGANGGACAASESQLPARPVLEAGSTAPLAGSFAPFVFRLSRQDGEQRFSSLTATLPKGLTGKLAGVPYCSEPQIAAAKAREVEGGGALELASSSCPAASQIGTVNVAAGAGSAPYYVQGRVYLAGPYKGAPLSFVIITPGVAGPFDLGAVVARAGLYVDESTAEITVKSDPIPTILQGIPLDVRKIAVSVDREGFTLNPTNCEATAVKAQVTMATGAAIAVQDGFQVGGCRNLGFSPKLQLSLKGATRRTGHPALKAVLTQPQGQANIGRASVALPPTEFVDPFHVANPCTRPQFAAGACPPSSVLGKATAYSPLLDQPLSGKVYFRANGGERALPDVVADLNGQVHLIVIGQLDALHKKGSEASRVRTTIATVPDAPVSKFVLELKGGKKHGVLVNSANICKTANKAIVKMRGQNGKTHDFNPEIATSCGGSKRPR